MYGLWDTVKLFDRHWILTKHLRKFYSLVCKLLDTLCVFTSWHGGGLVTWWFLPALHATAMALWISAEGCERKVSMKMVSSLKCVCPILLKNNDVAYEIKRQGKVVPVLVSLMECFKKNKNSNSFCRVNILIDFCLLKLFWFIRIYRVSTIFFIALVVSVILSQSTSQCWIANAALTAKSLWTGICQLKHVSVSATILFPKIVSQLAGHLGISEWRSCSFPERPWG